MKMDIKQSGVTKLTRTEVHIFIEISNSIKFQKTRKLKELHETHAAAKLNVHIAATYVRTNFQG